MPDTSEKNLQAQTPSLTSMVRWSRFAKRDIGEDLEGGVLRVRVSESGVEVS